MGVAGGGGGGKTIQYGTSWSVSSLKLCLQQTWSQLHTATATRSHVDLVIIVSGFTTVSGRLLSDGHSLN